MSRDFSANTDEIDVGTWATTGDSISILYWLQLDSILTGDGRFIAKSGGSGESQHTWMISNDHATLFSPRTRLRRNSNTDTFAHPSIGTPPTPWSHEGITYDGGSNSGVYYHDGGVHDTFAHTETTGDLGQDSREIHFGHGAPDVDEGIDGRLAWMAIWDVALSADEVAALASGVLPIFVRYEELLGCWPLWGTHSPEIDLSRNGNSGVITGPTRGASDPPVEPFLLGYPNFEEAVAAPAGIIPLIMHHRKMLGG